MAALMVYGQLCSILPYNAETQQKQDIYTVDSIHNVSKIGVCTDSKMQIICTITHLHTLRMPKGLP